MKTSTIISFGVVERQHFLNEAQMTNFTDRHIGPSTNEVEQMLHSMGVKSLDELIEQTIPDSIRTPKDLSLPQGLSEKKCLETLKQYADQNEIWRSYLGLGYHNCITPSVILRNLLENPGWYTSYTPYQAEISQGRMESLLIFQTVVQDLTGVDISNSSLLDEATAAAEAMTMTHRISRGKKGNTFFVSKDCHPQTIKVVQSRAEPLGLTVIVGDHEEYDFSQQIFGALLQYPATDGTVKDLSSFISRAHNQKALVTVATDLLALTLLKPPGEFGADIVVGNTQRFGVPLGYGGPHAAFLACSEAHKRHMPGRIIGVSIDADDNKALRMALQTREQHIRRQKATSNICTAQALLANIAAMFAVWHGPEGLKDIATQISTHAHTLRLALTAGGYETDKSVIFDTFAVHCGERRAQIVKRAAQKRINLRRFNDEQLIIALDETVTTEDVADLCWVFEVAVPAKEVVVSYQNFSRESKYLEHSFFHRYRSETEMMRYLHYLETKDLALNTAMIPLGSCTMKLNAATQMIPVTWKEFGEIHPYAPRSQAVGYHLMFAQLEEWLCEITGFDAMSLQPNAGSQGEYAGLLAIDKYHKANGESHRNICLIPSSAHGTNPASAVMAGMKVVAIKCDEDGNIDVKDLEEKAVKYKQNLAALMVTYPSTHGVFEESIQQVCEMIHVNGGQVYMDGANMNAIVGLCKPGEIGADVCHLNLHKTFSIPHGGGGPGMGPIGVKKHLAPHLPGDPLDASTQYSVSAAPYGSSSILPISWSYIALLGQKGVTKATKIAICAANYIATRLKDHYPVLYKGTNGRIAHECILDVRGFKESCGVTVDDIAKRLIDYGFHAPTMSWPVAGTLMVEPTESESLTELDRFIEAMIAIREEIAEVEAGTQPLATSPLQNAPHTAIFVTQKEWTLPYSRQKAAFPTSATLRGKYWPPVRRVNNAYGDRNLACSCMHFIYDEEDEAAK